MLKAIKRERGTYSIVVALGAIIGGVLRFMTTPTTHWGLTISLGLFLGFAIPTIWGCLYWLFAMYKEYQAPYKNMKRQKSYIQIWYSFLQILVITVGMGSIPSALYGLSLAVIIVILDALLAMTTITVPWLLSGAIYGAVWGVIVVLTLFIPRPKKKQSSKNYFQSS